MRAGRRADIACGGRARRRSFGGTLVEVAVYSALLLMLLAGTYTVVEGGIRYLRLGEVGETVNQQAIIGLRKVAFELDSASQVSLEVDSAPQEHVTFLSPRPAAGSSGGYTFEGGTLLEYKKWVSIFLVGESLVSVESDLGSPVSDPASLAVPDFSAEVLTWEPRKPLANEVKSVDFARLSPNVVRIVLVTSVSTGTGKTTELQVASSVRLLNE